MKDIPTVWSATPTPFLQDGALDVASLERVIEQHLALGVRGVLLGGSCGEGTWMPSAQRTELVRETVRTAGGRLRVTVQVSDTSPPRVRENMHAAEEAEADTVVIAAPIVDRFITREFCRRYFLESIEAARVPIGIYIMPSSPGSPMDEGLWLEIASHPAVTLLKDSSRSSSLRDKLGAIRKQRDDLLLLTGNEFDVIGAMEAGFDGGLLGTGILNARLVRKALDALQAGDRPEAQSWQGRSNALLYDLFGEDIGIWLGGLKYALKQLGIFSTETMLLDYPITDVDRQRIDTALEREKEHVCS